MYSDTLLALERAHLLQIIVWGGGSIVLGTALLVAIAVRRVRSPLLLNFGVQCLAWGAIDLLLAGVHLGWLTGRDLNGAVALDRLLWLSTGLNAGFVGVGLTLALTGWLLGRRMALIGAGAGVIVQGLALLVLNLRFVNALSPYI